MKALCVAFILSHMVFLPNVHAQTHPKLPLTEFWYQIQGQNKDDYISVRRYSLVVDTPDNLIRNTVIFHCSTKAADPSFITFIIPKEISLTKLLGKNHLTGKKFNLYTMPKNEVAEKHTATGEVKQNEIFFDFLGGNKGAISSMIDADKIFMLLNGNENPIEFEVPEPTFEFPFEGRKFKYDEFVRVMMDRSGKFTRQFQKEYLFENCVDLKKWRSENEELQNAN